MRGQGREGGVTYTDKLTTDCLTLLCMHDVLLMEYLVHVLEFANTRHKYEKRN